MTENKNAPISKDPSRLMVLVPHFKMVALIRSLQTKNWWTLGQLIREIQASMEEDTVQHVGKASHALNRIIETEDLEPGDLVEYLENLAEFGPAIREWLSARLDEEMDSTGAADDPHSPPSPFILTPLNDWS